MVFNLLMLIYFFNKKMCPALVILCLKQLDKLQHTLMAKNHKEQK